MNEHVPADAPRSYLASLLRLWTLRKVASPPSGRASPIVVCLGALWLFLWLAIDWWDAQPAPQFAVDGIPLLAWYVLAILGLAALLRWRAHPAPAFGSVLALTMGTVPVPLLFVSLVADYLQPAWVLAAAIMVGVYTLLYLARGLRALTGETQRAAACAGLVFIAGFGWLTDT